MKNGTHALLRTWVLRCGRCKAHRRLEVGELINLQNSAPYVLCCGVQMNARVLRGVQNETKCGARCTGSKGHVCDCSCGGKNHGTAV